MRSSGGCIINIVSVLAFQAAKNTESYEASKGGIIALTRALAASLSGYNIRVNSISPGWIHAGSKHDQPVENQSLQLSGRAGKPSDIVNLCCCWRILKMIILMVKI